VGRTCKRDSASCSLEWQRELILGRSPSEDICVKDHCVLGITEPAGIKAILLLEVGEDSKVGVCTNVLRRDL
jgi:hypothetical protein